MGMPVKLSDELVQQAREEAKAADRSVTSQIEHWARIGRSVETALRHDEVLALKNSDGDVEAAFPAAVTRRGILATLRRVALTPEGTESLIGERTVYQDDGSGRIERIDRNGARSVGKFVNRRFVPDASPHRARRK